jgi:uncharacterized protein (TIGR02598 family)
MKRTSGFSLVEVTLALGIAGFCLIAVFGLLPIGLKSNSMAIEQTKAVSVIGGIAADLRNTPRSATKSPRYQIDLPLAGTKTIYLTEDGVAVAQAGDARYRVAISAPAGPSGRMATWLDVKASWPAPAAPANAAGSVETFLALDRN